MERFWSKADRRGDDECWPWLHYKNPKGYGSFWWGPDGRMRSAHRVAYMLAIGPILPGLHVLHRCDNPSCVNPAHLRVGTNRENAREKFERGRGWQQRVTHCPKGHEYTADNTYFAPNDTRRQCRACKREYARARGAVDGRRNRAPHTHTEGA